MFAEKFENLKCPVLFLLLLFAVPVFAQEDDVDIYSLWPFSDNASVTLEAAGAQQNPSKFWQETIEVNGTKLQLEISLVETRLKDLRQQFSKLFNGRKDVFMGGNSNSILLQEIQKDGKLKRQFYLELSGIQPVLLFEMVLPPGLKKVSEEDWPAELPFIYGAVNPTSMKFPARGATYGAYSLKEMLMPQALGEVVNQLEAMGWEKVSREADNVFEGTGEIFLKDNASKLLILGIAPDADGRGVRVSMYTRPITKGE